MEFSQTTIDHVRPETDYAGRYEELLGEAKALGSELNIPYEWYSATLQILGKVRDHQPEAPWIACESLQGLPTALAIAEIKERFWHTRVNKAALWCAFLLHDNGKIDLPDEINNASHEGLIWPEEYRWRTEMHVVTGSRRAEEHGLPQVVTRPIAESHGKQLTPCYGVNPVLSPEELPVRNSLAIADALDAMFDRENTLNKKMSFGARIAYCEDYIINSCTDYRDSGHELAKFIIQCVVPRPALVAA